MLLNINEEQLLIRMNYDLVLGFLPLIQDWSPDGKGVTGYVIKHSAALSFKKHREYLRPELFWRVRETDIESIAGPNFNDSRDMATWDLDEGIQVGLKGDPDLFYILFLLYDPNFNLSLWSRIQDMVYQGLVWIQ